MDDLAGLDWNTPSQQSTKPSQPNNAANYYPTLKPTPSLSGRSTPILNNIPKGPATPANASTPQSDSFANLLPTSNYSQTTKNLSLKEQQALLEEQKRQKALSQARQWDSLGSGSTSTSASVSRTASPAQFSVQALNSQTSGPRLPVRSSTPLQQGTSANKPSRQQSEDINDILAAFDSSAPVNRSTHFPIPSRPESRNVNPPAAKAEIDAKTQSFDDDDDPFGLGTAPVRSAGPETSQVAVGDNDDDVLGLLGKPVSELPPRTSPASVPKPSAHPADAAVAELVDMGFSAEKAREALATTESGLDVQAAVGYLLTKAHSESRNSNKPSSNGSERRLADEAQGDPAWARQQKSSSRQREDRSEPAPNKDFAKYAPELGNNFFKAANSLWKAGQKKVNKAMAEFNAETDPAQPKWMRGAALPPESPSADTTSQILPERRSSQTSNVRSLNGGFTDEAALLEIGGGRPQPSRSKKSDPPSLRSPVQELNGLPTRQKPQERTEKPESTVRSRAYNQTPPLPSSARAKLTREMNEEATAYVSPARRKKPAPKPTEPEPNLLFDDDTSTTSVPRTVSSQTPPTRNIQTSKSTASRPVTATPMPPKPKATPRSIPSLGAAILQSSTSNRVKGTAAFKLGNYSDAHASYTAALRDVPKQHPLTIVLLTNRALTSLKTGDPKQCIVDADQAIEVIGPSKGKNETIDIGGDEGTKDMAPYWGKAMMRRAEAMEQLERWAEAAGVWKECVEAGVGGAQSVQGRARCEKASGTGQASQPTSRKPTPAPKKSAARPATRSALDDLSGRPSMNSTASSEAVTRLRAANDAAAKLDDERFALTDAVSERVEKWKKGKEQNLRALLGSLDTVLWENSGWKKIGMSELLNPGKVKIQYMKGIAKVHPDKVSISTHQCRNADRDQLSPTATTEQIMISGAVFSTLNEAWDGFKKENGL